MKEQSIGIDLGSYYSRISYFSDGVIEIIPNEDGEEFIRSCVAFTDDGIDVGKMAVHKDAEDLNNTAFGIFKLLGRSFNDPMVQSARRELPCNIVNGGGKPCIRVKLRKQQKLFSPEEIISMIIRKLMDSAEKYFGGSVDNAVITVPQYFNDLQKSAIRYAGELAGIHVLDIIEGATASSLAYGYMSHLESNATAPLERGNYHVTILVLELNYYTFSTSLIHFKGIEFELSYLQGHSLGCEDIDILIVKYLASVFKKQHSIDVTVNSSSLRRLKSMCNQLKVKLEANSVAWCKIESFHEGIDFYFSLSRDQYLKLLEGFSSKMLETINLVVNSESTSNQEVKEVVVIWGTTPIPGITGLISDHLQGKKVISKNSQPFAFSYGAALQANTIQRLGDNLPGISANMQVPSQSIWENHGRPMQSLHNSYLWGAEESHHFDSEHVRLSQPEPDFPMSTYDSNTQRYEEQRFLWNVHDLSVIEKERNPDS
ncbi:Hsp70 protein-domain-containing protein [Scheffersomyces xylosifermentans]|uniref:Hsp70 protein-domain-containing protein n=1 Tax=Scheffersomyces xylosifermentans TaxID=1304137 RepID=UPI00315D6A0B